MRSAASVELGRVHELVGTVGVGDVAGPEDDRRDAQAVGVEAGLGTEADRPRRAPAHQFPEGHHRRQCRVGVQRRVPDVRRGGGVAPDGRQACVDGRHLGQDVGQDRVRVGVGRVADLELHGARRGQHVDGHPPVEGPDVGADAARRVVQPMDPHGQGRCLVDGAGLDAGPAGVSGGGDHLEAVADLAGVGVAEPHAGRLPDHHHVGSTRAVLGERVQEAVDAYAAHLLVVAEAEVHRCPEGVEVGGLHQDEGGGQEALHVGRAPGAQLAVDLRQLVRVGGPARSGGHHVGVAGQQYAPGSVGPEPQVQVGPPGLAVHDGDHGAGGSSTVGVQVDQLEI